MRRRSLVLLFPAAVLLALAPLPAATAGETGLTASGGWSRPTASAGMAAVVYLTITDSGTPTALVGLSTPVAAQAEMHRSLERNGTVEMMPVKTMAIARGAPITFSPAGYHVMLLGLSKPLSVGERFPLTLRFAGGSRITTVVTVQPMAAPPPADAGGKEMSGMKM